MKGWSNMDNTVKFKFETKKFILSVFMVFVIGAMNSYTYFLRGETFASIHTGNIMKACFDIAEGKTRGLYRYFVPIAFFIGGIITHQLLKDRKKGMVICSIIVPVCYISGVLVPFGFYDFLGNACLAFGVGIQLQSLNKVNGVDITTTMCTGNIRSMTVKTVQFIKTRDKSNLIGILTYASLVIAFTVGVLLSALIIKSI